MSKSEQIWSKVFVVLPLILGMNLGNYVGRSDVSEILYIALFSGVGVVLGFMADRITKNEKTTIKIVALILVLAVCLLLGYILP